MASGDSSTAPFGFDCVFAASSFDAPVVAPVVRIRRDMCPLMLVDVTGSATKWRGGDWRLALHGMHRSRQPRRIAVQRCFVTPAQRRHRSCTLREHPSFEISRPRYGGNCHAAMRSRFRALPFSQRGDPMNGPAHGPYWKRAHRDWRVRAAAIVMALAMIIFVLTENLARRPGVHPSPPAASRRP
jgi:hypothetical protein